MTSPTSRTLDHCRNLGYTPWVVEHWQPFWRGKDASGAMLARGGVRQDLFGFVDVVALDGSRTYAIQTTVTGGSSAHRKKIEDSPHLAAVLNAGWLVEVWDWAKRGKAGKRKLWKLRRERLVGPETWTEVDDTMEPEEQST